MQIDELKLLLALNGNQRIPHHEEEIFADEEATTLYLNNLCREYSWYRPEKNSILADNYSFHVLGRWPAVEHMIRGTVNWPDYRQDYNICE